MSFYLVVYTATHLIGAVSPSLPDLDWCASLEDNYTERHSDRGYTFACEEHDKRPNVQIKIPAKDRRYYQNFCAGRGKCEELPNGDIVLAGKTADMGNCETTYRYIDTPRQKIVKDTCNIVANVKAKFDPQICVGNSLCRVHPNGDVEFHSSAHCYYIVAKKDVDKPNAKPIISTCPWDNPNAADHEKMQAKLCPEGPEACIAHPNGDVERRCYLGFFVTRKRRNGEWKTIYSTCKE